MFELHFPTLIDRNNVVLGIKKGKLVIFYKCV